MNDEQKDANAPFLTESFFHRVNQIMKFPPDLSHDFLKSMERMRTSESLRNMALMSHNKLPAYLNNEPDVDIWPEKAILTKEMGSTSGMFAAIIMLSYLPNTIEQYNILNIPDDILLDTMTDIFIWMCDYRMKYGEWGLENCNWLKRHFNTRIFRLGRLQFELGNSYYKINAFRNIHTGEVKIFSAADIWFNRDGFVDGNNHISDINGRWRSVLDLSQQTIIGTEMSPEGYAIKAPVRLSLVEWVEVLREDDPVLHVHIPKDGRMVHSLCRESYRLALDFFPKIFPKYNFKTFTCGSWLLNPQFKQLLPDTSNIIRFMNDYHLFPIKSFEEETLSRVFGAKQIDIDTALQDTMLQRKIIDFMRQGRRLISGGGILLREEVQ